MTCNMALATVLAQIPALDDRCFILAQLQGVLPAKSEFLKDIKWQRERTLKAIDAIDFPPIQSKLEDFL